MKPVVATIIYDRDAGERARILEGLREWRALGLEVIASAGRSGKELKNQAKDMGVTLIERDGLLYGNGMRQAIQAAGEKTDVVIWTEGDKSGKFGFQSHVSRCLAFFDRTKADITVIGRTKESMLTHPHQQKFSEEGIINFFYFKALEDIAGGQKYNITDFCYGPKIIGKRALKHFVESEHLNYAACFTPLLAAAKKGLNMNEIKVPMEFVLKNEFGDANALAFRAWQAYEIIEPIIAHYMEANPRRLLNFVLPELTKRMEMFKELAVGAAEDPARPIETAYARHFRISHDVLK